MLITIVGHLLAVAIGISLGLIGGGGSILAVPILVYVMGIGSKEAIAMSLFIVGIVSCIGAIPHWFQGNVNLKTVVMFTPAAMVGSFLGARLTTLPWITDTIQLIAFGVVMVLASVLMIRKQENKTPTSTEEKHPTYPKWLAIPIEGLAVGILTGFVGVGGGFLIIPALVLLGGIPMKEAIGTSLLIITFKSATGFLGYIDQVTVDWGLMFSFTLAASVGTWGGASLTQYIDGKKLQKGFGYFVLAIAVFVLVQR
ncbi:sulfite exporter TauE/SafE family protein [Spirulina subsalsa FACHB-351]|uniref:Probable membrane transporter protein n=1 Tax=Spirulina subsalsa FACHB-351 TaxID=234711 RepID=A0ABT3L603_9CYAN|nr:sulfite exporter TauE/SafE family protein [Spirulina subsalsa]MCW6036929.1 sulfite exporter TauE/SafE family protein [Spirulina subsalsa FACHB-351]